MICGVDEAGKGPVIGPLVVAAVSVDNAKDIENLGIKDSKLLTPEKRKELTTEGGLDLLNKFSDIKSHIDALKSSGIIVSLFIDPESNQIEASKNIGAEIIELHTGSYANAAQHLISSELNRLKSASQFASQLGLEVHAGHGLSYSNVENIARIPEIKEINIGHFIVGESIYVGIQDSVKKMKLLIDNAKGSG